MKVCHNAVLSQFSSSRELLSPDNGGAGGDGVPVGGGGR